MIFDWLNSSIEAIRQIPNMMNANHLKAIRVKEMETVLAWVAPGSEVLEIGAGSGWQAKWLADHNCNVQAIDIPGSYYQENREWHVREYNGSRIPFDDSSFDIVFSSNVLEHIQNVESFQAEIQRVLRQEGTAIHLLPTAAWRIWTNLTYYPFMFAEARDYLLNRTSYPKYVQGEAQDADRDFFHIIKRLFIAPRHGEKGNALSEVVYFSRWRWSELFRTTGWTIECYFTNQLFYTGYGLISASLSLTKRTWLSRALGSSCHVFILRKSS